MPAPIVLRNLSPAPKKVSSPPAGEPVIATREDLRDGSRGTAKGSVPQGVIFTESFDDIPDWHSGLPENDTGASPAGLPDRVQRAATHTFIPGWYSCYQDPRFAPSMGYPNHRETISILAADSDKTRNGTGKCYVGSRDSYDDGNGTWNSDSSLMRHLPAGYDQLYVEFWLKFSPEWLTASGRSKLFRIVAWNGEPSEYDYFGGGNGGPALMWGWVASQYGIRDNLSFRGGPYGENYTMTDADVSGLPRSLTGLGDLPMNWTQDMVGMAPGGATPQVPDKVNGGFISDDLNQIVTHDQVFGSTYNKVAFFVKMNSAPDVKDGVCKQWFNDERIFSNEQIAWVGPTSQPMPKWNDVAIGGNDFFSERPNNEAYQDWYAIDDIVCSTDIPAGLE